MKDMFGNELTEAQAYDLLKRKRAVPSGHAWKPGTGPAGETCGTCKHRVIKRLARNYQKCGKNESKWTGGPKSDIRAKDPACKFWEKNEEGNDGQASDGGQ